jgi:hypothetical protein
MVPHRLGRMDTIDHSPTPKIGQLLVGIVDPVN